MPCDRKFSEVEKEAHLTYNLTSNRLRKHHTQLLNSYVPGVDFYEEDLHDGALYAASSPGMFMAKEFSLLGLVDPAVHFNEFLTKDKGELVLVTR